MLDDSPCVLHEHRALTCSIGLSGSRIDDGVGLRSRRRNDRSAADRAEEMMQPSLIYLHGISLVPAARAAADRAEEMACRWSGHGVASSLSVRFGRSAWGEGGGRREAGRRRAGERCGGGGGGCSRWHARHAHAHALLLLRQLLCVLQPPLQPERSTSTGHEKVRNPRRAGRTRRSRATSTGRHARCRGFGLWRDNP